MKYKHFDIRNADKIKSSFAFSTGQHPVRDEILVEIEYPREHGRAVRYAIFLTYILSLTGQRVVAGFLFSTNILSLTGHPRPAVISIEDIILFMLLIYYI